MSDLLARFSSRELIGLIAVSGAFITALLCIAWGWSLTWQCQRRSQALLALKQSMIDRGYSPADIQQVTEADVAPTADVSVA